MNDQESARTEGHKKRHRSPNFPAVSLKKAVERTKELYSKAKTFDVLESVAHATWGYKIHSSGGYQTTAALRAFGLIEVSGSGKNKMIKVSDVGRRVILKADDWKDLIQRAAQRPKVHSQIFGHFGQVIPQDIVLRQYLTFDLNFNEESVGSFMSQFMTTVGYADLTSDAILGEDDGASGSTEAPEDALCGEDQPLNEMGKEMGLAVTPAPATATASTSKPTVRRHMDYSIPRKGGRLAVLRLEFPVSKEDIAQIEQWLKLMANTLEDEARTSAGD